MELTIRIQDPSGAVGRDVTVRAEEEHRVGDLLGVLVDVMEWPRATFEGAELAYEVRRMGDARALDHGTLIASLGLVRGDALVLGPVPAGER